MKSIKKLLITSVVSLFVVVSTNAGEKFIPSDNKNLAVEYTIDAIVDERFFKFTKKPLESIGFFVNDAHHNVQNVYAKQVGETSLDQLSFSSFIHDDKARPFFNKEPRLGGFTPFNLVIYRKKDDMKTVITHITPLAALDILQISDKEVREKFIDMFKPLDAAIEKEFSGVVKSYTKFHGFAKNPMMHFEIPFEEPEDIDDFFDDFQEEFESTFEHKGYIIAGFYDMKDSLNSDDDVLPAYEKYIVWSLCHIPFSYTIFDGKNPLPQAAVFAPCSMYVFIKKGENKIIIGMPTLNTWAAALNITDKDKLEKINELDYEIPLLIKSLGGIEVTNY
jgi:uncharacterized protein (DUF302 family)